MNLVALEIRPSIHLFESISKARKHYCTGWNKKHGEDRTVQYTGVSRK